MEKIDWEHPNFGRVSTGSGVEKKEKNQIEIGISGSIDFDDKYTNAKISGLDRTAYFESHGNNNTEICKKCIHGDNKGGCVTRYESPFNSFGCIKNNQFESIKE